MKELNSALGALSLGIFKIVALILYSAFAWGFITYKFYHWFLLPVFEQLPVVGYLEAVSLSMVLTLFNKTQMPQLNKELYSESSSTRILSSMLLPWIVLGGGYLISLFLN
jgi:hypothetical protein